MGMSHLKYTSIHTSHISSAQQSHETGCWTEQHSKTLAAPNTGMTWELIRNAESQASPQTHWLTICSLARSQGICMHISLKKKKWVQFCLKHSVASYFPHDKSAAIDLGNHSFIHHCYWAPSECQALHWVMLGTQEGWRQTWYLPSWSSQAINIDKYPNPYFILTIINIM